MKNEKTLVLKNSKVIGKKPELTDLIDAELAVNVSDARIYMKRDDGARPAYVESFLNETEVIEIRDNLQAQITSNDEDIAALDARVTTNEGDIATNVTDIEALDVRVSNNETNIGNNATDIEALDGRVTKNESDITNINADITSLQGDSHTHSNKALLDTITDTGDGTKYLADDGTYKLVESGTDLGYGTAGQVLATNTTEDGYEWVDGGSGGGCDLTPPQCDAIKANTDLTSTNKVVDANMLYAHENNTISHLTYDQHKSLMAANSPSETNPVVTENDLTPVVDGITAHVNDNGNPHNVTKDQVGLGNVDNTSDVDKPISNAVQAALLAKQDDLGLGSAGQILATNAATDGTEWIDAPSGGSPDAVTSTTSGVETRIAEIVSISQADYDALATKQADKLYIIV